MDESADSLCSRPGCIMFGMAVSSLTATVSKALKRPGAHIALAANPLEERVPLSTGEVEGSNKDGSNVFAVSNKLRDEWDEFFAEGIFTVMVPLFIKVNN